MDNTQTKTILKFKFLEKPVVYNKIAFNYSKRNKTQEMTILSRTGSQCKIWRRLRPSSFKKWLALKLIKWREH
jgi:hypothetical protein